MLVIERKSKIFEKLKNDDKYMILENLQIIDKRVKWKILRIYVLKNLYNSTVKKIQDWKFYNKNHLLFSSKCKIIHPRKVCSNNKSSTNHIVLKNL